MMVAEVTLHGRSGYRKGCKCGTCRGAHADYMSTWRARRRERAIASALADAEPLVDRPVSPPVAPVSGLDLVAAAGPLETAFLEDITTPDAQVAFRRSLVGLGRLNMRILDQVGSLDRLDLVSPLQLRQLEVFQRLALIGFKGLGDDGTPKPDGVAAEAEKLLADIAAAAQDGDSGAGGR